MLIINTNIKITNINIIKDDKIKLNQFLQFFSSFVCITKYRLKIAAIKAKKKKKATTQRITKMGKTINIRIPDAMKTNSHIAYLKALLYVFLTKKLIYHINKILFRNNRDS